MKLKLRPAANAANEGELPLTQPSTQPPGTINILHPGYSGADARLLSLLALDNCGIDYDTALMACGILTGNRWDNGFFSFDRAGKIRIGRPGGILRFPRFFFQIPGPPGLPYPVVPQFRHWRFPHGKLPPSWEKWAAAASATRVEAATAGRCVMSYHADDLEMAHLVPASEDEWWRLNRMQDYSPVQLSLSTPIDEPANRMALRANLYRVLEEGHFCWVPKVEGRSPGGREEATKEQKPPQLVSHVFSSTPSEKLPELWHNRSVHPLPTVVTVEFLFARFAWTILSPGIFNTFLLWASVPKYLLHWNAEEGKHQNTKVSPEACIKLWEIARSCSPQMRSANAVINDLPVGEMPSQLNSTYTKTDISEEGGYHPEHPSSTAQEEEQPRGRSRRQRSV